MKKKIWLILSVALNFILVSALILVLVKTNLLSSLLPGETSATTNPKYEQKVSLFKELETEKTDVVFLGDSLTERSLWAEIFPEKVVANRGIESDTTDGLLKRLDGIGELSPEQAFVMIGVNDIIFDKDPEVTIGNYSKIISKLKSESPDTELYIQSLLPVKDGAYGIDNKSINSMNEKIKELAAKEQVEYMDINSKLKDEDGVLMPEYSEDGLHLNGNAYMVWAEEIKGYIE